MPANQNFTFAQNADFNLNQLLNAVLQVLTVDPASPVNGQIWYRSDTKVIKFYDGTSVQVLADGVNSISAADSTITLGGTSTSVTIKVAKALDHTYITDFDAQVRTSRLDQMAVPTATVSMNSQVLSNLADPANPQDGVNLRFLESFLNGFGETREAYYATATALPANTYANGTAGVGATLTATANGTLTVDGVAAVVNDRVLVGNEATQADNGLYVVTATGSAGAPYVLTRVADLNTANDFAPGMLIAVKSPAGRTAGTGNDDRIYVQVCPASGFVVGTTSVSYAQAGGTYSAGAGLTLTGTVFSLTSPVTVLLGGTGATTAAGARTNLGAAGLFTTIVGDGAATSYVIAHNLNNAAASANVVRNTDGTVLRVGVVNTTANSLTIYVSVAPATNTLTVSVTG